MFRMGNKYETPAQTAARWGVTDRLVRRYASEGRIRGALRIGAAWAIPAGAARPVLRRGPRPRPRKGTA